MTHKALQLSLGMLEKPINVQTTWVVATRLAFPVFLCPRFSSALFSLLPCLEWPANFQHSAPLSAFQQV